MSIAFVPFTGWNPRGGYFGEGWSTVYNLAPIFEDWRPWPKFRVGNPALPTTTFGPLIGTHTHLWASGINGTTYAPDSFTLFAGSKTRLFEISGAGSFNDVSRAANYGAGAGTEPAGWRFVSIGNDIYCTNWFDPVQRRTNNTGLFADGLTGAFLPTPRFLAAVREHMVGANLSNAGRFQDEVVWSDADNPTDFNPPTGTSTSIAGSKRLVSVPGQITGLVGGQYGLAFKRRAIFLLQYTGTSQVFRPELLSEHVGTAYGSSIINTRYGVFFLGPDGFYQLVGLGAPAKISSPGLDEVFLATAFARQNVATTASLEDSQMIGFSFPGQPLVGWMFHNEWGSAGNDLVILYNPVTQQWALADGRLEVAADMSSPYETTAVVVRPYGNDSFDTVGALSWDGTEARRGFLSSSNVNAPSLELRYRPANWEEAPNEFQQTIITGIMPLFSKTSPTGTPLTHSVTVTPLYDPNGSPGTAEVSPSTNRNMAGWHPFAISSRMFRITIEFSSGEALNSFEGIYINQEMAR